MALLNYTTSVDPARSLGQIERMLIAFGASHITRGYGADRQPESLSFVFKTAFGDRCYKLPANVAAVEAVLKDQLRRKKVPARFATRDQARRVAWRILKDWIEAMIAVIEAKMVQVDEVFLAYMLNDKGVTLYESMREQQLALTQSKGTGA